ncbi:MAG: hypothetical protein AB1487_06170 [Thermodesulfobacteriota bacterium]
MYAIHIPVAGFAVGEPLLTPSCIHRKPQRSQRDTIFRYATDVDEFVKSPEIVMPDLIRHPEHIEFARFRLEFTPYLIRGRNDKRGDS